jgi:hypothetical protein
VLHLHVSIPLHNVHLCAIAMIALLLQVTVTQSSFADGRTIEPVILPEGGSRRWNAGST